MTFVTSLEPAALWGHFDAILTIPRGSKNEERMRAHVLSVAARASLAHAVDGAGNVVVRKPGTAGREAGPVTILQSHLDMVNEKNSDVTHDFTRDPIVPRRDGDFLTASGTTLGSDNGIGVAAMLALMEATDLAHGPLEFLFTIDEETGLTGAAQLDGALLTGSTLLNLDSEEEGVLYVGCAGGGDSAVTLPVRASDPPAGWTALSVGWSGFKGGHSGVDIHLQRGNAVQLLARTLWAAAAETPIRIASIAGGSAHNAIPREANAVVLVAAGARQPFEDALQGEAAAIESEYEPADPGARFAVGPVEPRAAWDDATSAAALHLLVSLPHGVLAMSYAIPDLVETSNNLATVAVRDGALHVTTSARSSVDTALAAVRRRVRATALLAGATVVEAKPYPGWQPDLTSPVLGVVRAVSERLFGAAPGIKAIHAGLECGIIGTKVPDLDMISFGPQIEFPHSPDERVHVESVGRFYRLLTATLEALA